MTLGISIRQLEYVMALKQTGSFSAAAKLCHVSQPALSESIQKFEAELGVVLFDRGRNPIQPTEVGLAVLKQTEKAFSEIQHIVEVAGEWNDEIRGHLKLGIIPTLAPALIPLFLKSVRKKYPLLKIEISEQPTEHLVKKLGDGTIDAAILSTPAASLGTFVDVPLFYEPFQIYAGKGNRLLDFESVTFTDLEDQNLVLLDESHCMRDQILSICEKKKEPASKTTVRGGIQTLLTVVDEEEAFTLIPELLSGLVKKNQLREIRSTRFYRKISVLTRDAHSRKMALETVIKEIQGHLPANVPARLGHKSQVIDPNRNRF